jgi:hypothetical protein
MKSITFWNCDTVYSLVKVYWDFDRTYRVHLQDGGVIQQVTSKKQAELVNEETVRSSETSVKFYKITRRQIQKVIDQNIWITLKLVIWNFA